MNFSIRSTIVSRFIQNIQSKYSKVREIIIILIEYSKVEIWKILAREKGGRKGKEIDIIKNCWGRGRKLRVRVIAAFEDKATDHILSNSNSSWKFKGAAAGGQVVHAGLARAWINWIKKSFSRGKGKGFPNDWALFFRREMHSPLPLLSPSSKNAINAPLRWNEIAKKDGEGGFAQLTEAPTCICAGTISLKGGTGTKEG